MNEPVCSNRCVTIRIRERDYRFAAVESGGWLELVAVDADGNIIPGGHILAIDRLGQLRLFTSVSRECGVTLNRRAQIQRRLIS